MAERTRINERNVVVCDDFDDFAQEVRRPAGTLRLFRGQSNVNWQLSSPFERLIWNKSGGSALAALLLDLKSSDNNFYNQRILEVFRDAITGVPGIDTSKLTDHDLLAIGRHHGLVTPLLDWTESPFIAVFFSCFDLINNLVPGFKSGVCDSITGPPAVSIHESANYISVWELKRDDRLEELRPEFEIIYSRIDQSHRQKAQRGCFTYLKSNDHLELECYLTSKGLGHALTQYWIPECEAITALYNLNLMNIRYASLFPDIEGAAVHANTNWITRLDGSTERQMYYLTKLLLGSLEPEQGHTNHESE